MLRKILKNTKATNLFKTSLVGWVKNTKRTSVTMKKRGFSHWSDFTVAEKSAQWYVAELSTKHIGIMIWFSV